MCVHDSFLKLISILWGKSLPYAYQYFTLQAIYFMWHATILDFIMQILIYAKTAKLYKLVRPLKAWVKKL